MEVPARIPFAAAHASVSREALAAGRGGAILSIDCNKTALPLALAELVHRTTTAKKNERWMKPSNAPGAERAWHQNLAAKR